MINLLSPSGGTVPFMLLPLRPPVAFARTFSNFPSRDARPSNNAVVALPNALFTYKVQGVEYGEDLPLHQSHFALPQSLGLRVSDQLFHEELGVP